MSLDLSYLGCSVTRVGSAVSLSQCVWKWETVMKVLLAGCYGCTVGRRVSYFFHIRRKPAIMQSFLACKGVACTWILVCACSLNWFSAKYHMGRADIFTPVSPKQSTFLRNCASQSLIRPWRGHSTVLHCCCILTTCRYLSSVIWPSRRGLQHSPYTGIAGL